MNYFKNNKRWYAAVAKLLLHMIAGAIFLAVSAFFVRGGGWEIFSLFSTDGSDTFYRLRTSSKLVL